MVSFWSTMVRQSNFEKNPVTCKHRAPPPSRGKFYLGRQTARGHPLTRKVVEGPGLPLPKELSRGTYLSRDKALEKKFDSLWLDPTWPGPQVYTVLLYSKETPLPISAMASMLIGGAHCRVTWKFHTTAKTEFLILLSTLLCKGF